MSTTSEMAERKRHERFMRKALDTAEEALKQDETPVGCVFVYKDEAIASGMNETNRTMNGTRHCELVALSKIMRSNTSDILSECELYVTVEPCVMCASMLRQIGIKAVYYGCSNEKFGGTGGVLHLQKEPNIDPPYPAIGGIFREEAIMLLRRFYVQENEKAPEALRKKHRELKTDIPSLDATKDRA